ncbi:rod shape-determining protein MreD [Occallatibacter savannae]|uniref:rod shape-determining protein MreD n=1 Tax=Occallatibacter savannae TaxID=1002691 RepID=UPI000D68ABAE|nr:rod shape-determining protein MreD [Occallatibacter savannae]
MSVLSADARRDYEIHRYPVLIYALVPVLAVVLQAWLPRLLHRYAAFDLPLVVTVFFGLSRRNPIQGSILGGILGIFEDALTGHPIGINGIAKTLVGYLAATVGILVNVENHAVRLIMTFVLSLVGSATYFFVVRFLLGMSVDTNWMAELYKAIGNSVIALVLFPILDRAKIRD